MIDEDTIALVSTDVLIQELKDRHPQGAIIAIHHEPHEVRSSKQDWRICFAGDKTITLKLAMMSVWLHQQDFLGGADT